MLGGGGHAVQLGERLCQLGHWQSRETGTTQKSLSNQGNLLAPRDTPGCRPGCTRGLRVSQSPFTLAAVLQQDHSVTSVVPLSRNKGSEGPSPEDGVRLLGALPGRWHPWSCIGHCNVLFPERHRSEIMWCAVICGLFLLVTVTFSSNMVS